MEREVNCWQCGSMLNGTVRERTPKPAAGDNNPPAGRRAVWPWRKPPVKPAQPLSSDELIQFEEGVAEPVSPEELPSATFEVHDQPATRTVTTLTGEVVEVPIDVPAAIQVSPTAPDLNGPPAAQVGGTAIGATDEPPLYVQSFCKNCGFQNDEDKRECARCRLPLEMLTEPVPDLQDLPRAWGYDVLGAAWIVLGIAAIVAGRFLLKSDLKQAGAGIVDYLSTGVVACLPGVLVILRHNFCKILFWAMTWASVLVWVVIGFIWLYVGKHWSDNETVGLIWLALLSGLSAASWAVVRLNDAFDFSF